MRASQNPLTCVYVDAVNKLKERPFTGGFRQAIGPYHFMKWNGTAIDTNRRPAYFLPIKRSPVSPFDFDSWRILEPRCGNPHHFSFHAQRPYFLR